MFRKKNFKIKIKINEIDSYEKYFPKIKNYNGWVDVSMEPAVKALFCAVFNLKSKKDMQEKIIEILNFYKDAPLLSSYFEYEREKRSFSRFIVFLILREIARKISNRKNRVFDKFNDCIRN